MGRRSISWGAWFCLILATAELWAQQSAALPEPAGRQAKLPNIADEPKTIDPAQFMPAALAAPATQTFSDASLRDVVQWLQDKQRLEVLVDENALSANNLSLAEPISDALHHSPIYLLLNRLQPLEVDWYFEEGILHLTSREAAAERTTTVPYNVGDLLDAGYELADLEEVVTQSIAPNTWQDAGGVGALNTLGDVLFVRQTDPVQREIQGLLAALRKPARRTFISEPVQHTVLREKLDAPIRVEFQNTPLETVVQRLADLTKADIRLDVPALRESGLRQREPVTLKLENSKLKTVLQALTLNLRVSWTLRDGVLWITSPDAAEKQLKTAVYDVRDLCRNTGESDALLEAITAHAEPSSWDEVGGPGAIHFAKPGVMVVTHLEQLHRELLELLETYRASLRASRPREQQDDPQRIETVYYRLHTPVARNLVSLLPQLVQPGSWKSEQHPESRGEIILAASAPELSSLNPLVDDKNNSSPAATTLVIDRSVLIITHTRSAHTEIEEVIRRIESGDARGGSAAGLGGFGGGFFSVDESHR